jgi:hypothetical protein
MLVELIIFIFLILANNIAFVSLRRRAVDTRFSFVLLAMDSILQTSYLVLLLKLKDSSPNSFNYYKHLKTIVVLDIQVVFIYSISNPLSLSNYDGLSGTACKSNFSCFPLHAIPYVSIYLELNISTCH